jgi:hypothetical protein
VDQGIRWIADWHLPDRPVTLLCSSLFVVAGLQTDLLSSPSHPHPVNSAN